MRRKLRVMLYMVLVIGIAWLLEYIYAIHLDEDTGESDSLGSVCHSSAWVLCLGRDKAACRMSLFINLTQPGMVSLCL